MFQEADITGACESFTKHSYLVKSVEDLPRVFKEAFHIASTGRPGPVLIDVPEDVQEALAPSFSYPEKADIPGYKPKTAGHPVQLKRALEAIGEARRPHHLLRGRCGARRRPGGDDRLRGEKRHPHCVHHDGHWGDAHGQPGVLGDDWPLWPQLRQPGHRRSGPHHPLRARVGDRAIALPNQIAEQARTIHIDIDPAEIGKNMRADIPIVGDVKQVLAALAEKVQPVGCQDWVERVLRYKREFVPRGQDREDFVEPRSFIRKLSAMMEEDAILTADPGRGRFGRPSTSPSGRGGSSPAGAWAPWATPCPRLWGPSWQSPGARCWLCAGTAPSR